MTNYLKGIPGSGNSKALLAMAFKEKKLHFTQFMYQYFTELMRYLSTEYIGTLPLILAQGRTELLPKLQIP